MTTDLRCRRATLTEIMALRHAELRPGLPRETAAFDGDDEARTLHVGAFRGDEAVGCASLMARPWQGEDARQLRGMATRADLVRHGIGRALLACADALLDADGAPRLLWCNARVGAIPFYEKAGWQITSGVFDVPTVGPHVVMIRRR